ncbi:hypothetical protein N866_10815 [Actinotalea ferrariae CF5-4]|uniref:Prepilin-type N-terminal cleavage/methylation domain-containing protein n=1 Tax=Actinotalea ferrariae CF5-4 TaxID=948458 RepID=A0A021VWR2_9CELL|nr:hypothetical protein [Actinotalea ferrariae]EYR64450.1 hypothetical protein N866_10815 [Actinotalea ferrariae CF5-4]
MSRLLHRVRREDAGFGLIEAVVALLIAGVVFGALATSLIAAVQASLYSRQNQQATDFMTRELEDARALDFGALAHPAAPAAVAPLESCGAGTCLRVESVPEPLVVESGGAIDDSKTLLGLETNNTEYTVRTFVTQALGEPVENLRRVTVEISWLNRGVERTRSTSTLVAFVQRGLPLPVFRVDLAEPALTRNPGGTFAFEITVTNQGAPDTFDLAHNGGSNWAFYLDDDGDGSFDPALDTTVVTDTGRLDPASTVTLFLVRQTTATSTLGTQTIVATATSRGQPLATGGSKSVQAVATLQSGVITPPPPPGPGPYTPLPQCVAATTPTMPVGSGAYSALAYTLQHNGVGASALQSQMYMGTAAGDETVLSPYSTDLDSAALGRILRPVPAGTATDAQILALADPTRYADWALQYNRKADVQGQPVLRVWVQRHTGTGPVALKAVLYGATSSGASLSRTPWTSAPADLGTLSCVVAATPGWQEVWITLPDIGTRTVQRNGWMGVRLVATHTTTDEVRLAYDVPAQFAATLTARVK